MNIDELYYQLSKAVPDMRRGFVIQTNYGELAIDADSAKPIVDAVAKVLNRKISKALKEQKHG
jgi:hypothetical protein